MTNSRNSQNSDSTFGNSNNRFPPSDPEAQKQFADLAPGYLLGEHKNYRLGYMGLEPFGFSAPLFLPKKMRFVPCFATLDELNFS